MSRTCALQLIAQLPYPVAADGDGHAAMPCAHAPDGSGGVYPEEVAAEVIRHLVQTAEEQTGAKFDRAVISVPAYFDPEQCDATETAGAHLWLMQSAEHNPHVWWAR